MNKPNILSAIGVLFYCIAVALSPNNLTGLIQVLCISFGLYFIVNSLSKPEAKK